MSYLKFEIDGPLKKELSPREIDILQTTFLNLAAMTNALITGKGVMLNPPDEGKLGVTLAFSEKLLSKKENELSEALLKKINNFLQMSKLELSAHLTNSIKVK
ncbi:hypothetical protein [Solibacillus sp. FSL W7-1324]|uniref:hypothetical protein n=1 Tax=Solibacillus sp. FSL W7-1324 TaxID=2921701 RepID=UPI0030FC7585